MTLDLRLPDISGTDHEKLEKIRSYLFQIAGQLQFALGEIDATVKSTETTIHKIAPNGEVKIDKQSTFDSIKALIIKSADIVEAYSDEITKTLEGKYVAVSEFGTYTEETKNKIEANSTGISQVYTNTQTIKDDLEGIIKKINTRAYINTGALGSKDGKTIYGLEIGQRDEANEDVFYRYARFTADRLSFFDEEGNEVAYISSNKLHITNAEITNADVKELKMGKFVLDSNYGLTLKWVEGGK